VPDNGNVGFENHQAFHGKAVGPANMGAYGFGGGESFGDSVGDSVGESFGDSFGEGLGTTADIRQNQSSAGLMNFGRGGGGDSGGGGSDEVRFYPTKPVMFDEQMFYNQKIAYKGFQ
jgi:hypothetical protein